MHLLSYPYLHLVGFLKLCIVSNNTVKQADNSLGEAIIQLPEECQLLFSPQQGLFQDEGKLAFYFPSQVSMETACNHDICKQQLPIQLHTIFSYFEHFCHNFDIPEMFNNCFLTFLLPAHTVIWGYFCS